MEKWTSTPSSNAIRLPCDSNHGVQCAGEGPCLLTYFVTSYWQLFILRALTGISIGGCLPLVFNLLGDLFDAQHRANVLSGVLIATGAGTAIGQALAGLIGENVVGSACTGMSLAEGYQHNQRFRTHYAHARQFVVWTDSSLLNITALSLHLPCLQDSLAVVDCPAWHFTTFHLAATQAALT